MSRNNFTRIFMKHYSEVAARKTYWSFRNQQTKFPLLAFSHLIANDVARTTTLCTIQYLWRKYVHVRITCPLHDIHVPVFVRGKCLRKHVKYIRLTTKILTVGTTKKYSSKASCINFLQRNASYTQNCIEKIA